MKDQAGLIRMLLNESDFEHEIKVVIAELLKYSELDIEKGIEYFSHLPFSYAFDIYVNIVHSIVMTWLKRDFKESPKQVADYTIDTLGFPPE